MIVKLIKITINDILIPYKKITKKPFLNKAFKISLMVILEFNRLIKYLFESNFSENKTF